MSDKSFLADPQLTEQLTQQRFQWCADSRKEALWWCLHRARGITRLAELSLELLPTCHDPRQQDIINSLESSLLSIRLEIEDSMTLTEDSMS